MPTGIVKTWKHAFGFITNPDGGSKDVFVHVSALPPGRTELVSGEAVTYDLGTSDRGPIAVNVQVVSGKQGEVEKAWATHDR
jgi:cold shock protein